MDECRQLWKGRTCTRVHAYIHTHIPTRHPHAQTNTLPGVKVKGCCSWSPPMSPLPHPRLGFWCLRFPGPGMRTPRGDPGRDAGLQDSVGCSSRCPARALAHRDEGRQALRSDQSRMGAACWKHWRVWCPNLSKNSLMGPIVLDLNHRWHTGRGELCVSRRLSLELLLWL